MLPTITSDWFEFRHFGDGLTLITEPHVVPLLRCNIWHIAGRDIDLVVDTGLGVSSLYAASRHLFGQRVAALATHAHLDHVGGHHEFSECWCHRLEAPGLRGADPNYTLADFDLRAVNFSAPGYETGGPALTALPSPDYDLSAWEIKQATVTRELEDGDTIDLGNRHFEVLHLPGHSPGSIGLWEAKTCTLFSGDAVYDGPLLDALPHSDRAAYARTMERLLRATMIKSKLAHDLHAGMQLSEGTAMKQQTLAMAADQTFENYRKPTRRDEFLKTMELIVPWSSLCGVIEPHYPQAGNGRPPIGLERMLRIHFIQHWFNLADMACEEALYDSASLRRFVGIDLGREPVPDSTTITKFRKLLNDNKLGEALFSQVGQELQARGFKVNTGTIVDATIIGAPSSTKNADKTRDPDMHQTRKGQQWYFGMKLHIGVDSQTGLAHSAVVTPANMHDKHPLPDLLHGNEQRVYGDSAYASQKQLIASKAPKAKDFTNQRARFKGFIDEAVRAKNRNKSRIRARVEHVFGVVKRLWGFGKVRYRGLQKNATRAFTALALANIYLGRKNLLAQVRS